MNSQDIAYGYAIGYNDGLGSGGEMDLSEISGVIYTGGNYLKIVTKKDNVDTDNIFYLDIKPFTKAVTTTATKTASDGTTTTETSTRTWSKNIITAIYNSDMNLLYRCDTDSDGNMTALYDGDGNVIAIADAAVALYTIEEVMADE